MEVVQEGVTAPIGFQASGIHCGVKKARKDVALVYTETPAVAAAMFTTNASSPRPSSWTGSSWRSRRSCARSS